VKEVWNGKGERAETRIGRKLGHDHTKIAIGIHAEAYYAGLLELGARRHTGKFHTVSARI